MAEDRPPICDYEGSDYQTEFWEEGGREYEDRVEQIALKRLLPYQGDLLLEVGAGAGRNTPRYTGFDTIVLLDYSLTQLQKAQERLGKSKRHVYVAGDVYRLPFVSGLFDCATMIRTLHHMADAPTALEQIRRVMQNKGVFILEYANKRNLKAIARYLLGWQDWNPFSPHPVEFTELHYDFHPRTIRKWLRDLDFRIDDQLTVSYFRIDYLKHNVPTPILVALDSIAQYTGYLFQFSPSVFVRNTAVGDRASSESGGRFFQCPKCESSSLTKKGDHLLCLNCDRVWPIRDGIYDFREK